MKRKFFAWSIALIMIFSFGGCKRKNGLQPVGTEYLPIGTIVSLDNNPNVRISIVGYAATQVDAEEKMIWDYSGCLYPQGVLSPEELYLFNHDMITAVHFMGYVDNSFKEFLPMIHDVLD